MTEAVSGSGLVHLTGVDVTVPVAVSFLHYSMSRFLYTKAIASMLGHFASPMVLPVKHLVHQLQSSVQAQNQMLLQPSMAKSLLGLSHFIPENSPLTH